MSLVDIRKKTAERMTDGAHCRVCSGGVLWATASDCGGMCFGCFKAYCREPFHQHERSPVAERIRAEIAALGRSLPA